MSTSSVPNSVLGGLESCFWERQSPVGGGGTGQTWHLRMLTAVMGQAGAVPVVWEGGTLGGMARGQKGCLTQPRESGRTSIGWAHD